MKSLTPQLPVSAKNALAKEGWFSFRDAELAKNILQVSSQIGEPIYQPNLPVIGILKPQQKETARPKSTSAIYGLNAFPLHTDMAHWPVPPRYLVMRASTFVPGLPTTLVDSHKLTLNSTSRENWQRASWKVSGIQKPYLCSVFFDHKGSRGFRWDICTMSPYDKLAYEVLPEISSALQKLLDNSPIFIDWQSSEEILIIDNWRIAHMRPAVPEFAKNRTIERVLVKETDSA